MSLNQSINILFIHGTLTLSGQLSEPGDLLVLVFVRCASVCRAFNILHLYLLEIT